MPRFVTKQDWVAVSGVADLHVRSLLDRHQFDDPLGIAAALGISSAAWPLFGLLWPSGQQLAARMAARPVRAGERILEVGCGLALASLVCHRRGADVTASDCHPLAEAFLRENLRLNGLAPLPYRVGHWAAPAGAGGAHRVAGRFDLVIGSDLLYERDESGALAGFIERHAMPACEVWIVDPNRGNRPAFTRALQGHGFVLEELRLDTAATPAAAAYKGRLLIYRR